MKHKRMIACLLTCILLVSTGVGIGYLIGRGSSMPQQKEATGYVENPAYEYLVGAAAWQMSAEAHTLMIQGFHIAEENITILWSWQMQALTDIIG